jgi:hypothetical protein
MTSAEKQILVNLASDACAYGVQISRAAIHGRETSQDEISNHLSMLVTLAITAFATLRFSEPLDITLEKNAPNQKN